LKSTISFQSSASGYSSINEVTDLQIKSNNLVRKTKLLRQKLSYLDKYDENISEGDRFLSAFDQIEEIGKGQYGQVFKGRDGDGEYYAFKRIRMFGEEDRDKKILREVEAHRKLKHENVVNFREFWIDISPIIIYLYLFMELCAESLADWFERENNV
jgi:serine/threonine protein kinase